MDFLSQFHESIAQWLEGNDSEIELSLAEPGCEKKLDVLMDPSLEQEELLPLMLKAASKGVSAAGLCWQRGFPWGPDADVGNRH